MSLAQSTDPMRFWGSSLGWVYCILGLPGMDLTVFTAAGLVLCFGFVTKTVLITHQCFGCFWMMLAKPQGRLFFPCCCQRAGWGGQEDGRGHSWPKLAREYSIPCGVLLSNKNWGRETRGEFNFQGDGSSETAWALV